MSGRNGLVTAILILACVAEGRAQSATFEWVPYGGVFVPTRELGTTEIGGTTYEIKQKTSAALGARLVGWWSRVIGWEGNFAYALGDGQLKSAAGGDYCATQDVSCSADVWFASSKLLFRYAPSERLYLFGGAGVMVSGHVGDLWERADATTDLGGVVGIGGVFDISRRFAIRVDAEDYFYKFAPKLESDPEVGTFTGCSKVQNDLVFSAGLVIRLAGM
ncbi:MAG TPA: hypothetical protein VLC48_05960 [Gemmatimonadota bacterium]|nr:hypothetical protein [Gemmatimonadota bacterium]